MSKPNRSNPAWPKAMAPLPAGAVYCIEPTSCQPEGVALLKGQPVASGFAPARMPISVLING